MFNNRNTNFIIINYTNKINKTLNQTISEINNTVKTNSISYNFINQISPYMKFALKTAEYTLNYSNRAQSSNIARSICKTYPEIIDDMQKIKNVSLKFKSCCECVSKYNTDFNQIAHHTLSQIKKINCKQNISFYFLKLMAAYYDGESKMLKNILQYRICPQLRLITEYMLCLNNQKLKEIDTVS